MFSYLVVWVSIFRAATQARKREDEKKNTYLLKKLASNNETIMNA